MQNIDANHINNLCRTWSNRVCKSILSKALGDNPSLQHCLNPERQYRTPYTPSASEMQSIVSLLVQPTVANINTVIVVQDTCDLHNLATMVRDAFNRVALSLVVADNKIPFKKRDKALKAALETVKQTFPWTPQAKLFAPKRKVSVKDFEGLAKECGLTLLQEIVVQPPKARYVDPDQERAKRAAVREKKRQDELKTVENEIRKNFGL